MSDHRPALFTDEKMNMATCHFCGGKFRNSQSVRAHLKACTAYHAGESDPLKSALGKDVPKGTVPRGTMPKTQSEERYDPPLNLPTGELRALSDQLQEARLRRAIKKIQAGATADLLDLYAGFKDLMDEIRIHLWWNRVSDHSQGTGEPGWLEWFALAKDILKAYRQVEKMITQLDPDLSVLPKMYLQMKDVRAKWEHYRSWAEPDFPDSLEEMKGNKEIIQKELSQVDAVLSILRRLVV